MFKLNTYYEKEKLPTIYSPNNIPKSLFHKRKVNFQNIFEQTYTNSIQDSNKNNFNRIKNLLRDVESKNKLNSVHSKIMTIYNKNKKLDYKIVNEHRNKSYNNRTQLQNRIPNEINVFPFNDSFNNPINIIKGKNIKFKLSKMKELSKDFDNNKLKPLIMMSKKYNNPLISQNQTMNTKNKVLNNIKLINKKKEESFGERLKKFFMPNTASAVNKSNRLNDIKYDNLNKKKCTLCNKLIDIYRYNTHYNLHPSKIFSWLYLGSYQNACNSKDLKDLKIGYVLNCAAECENKNFADIIYFQVKLNDFPNFNISSFFKKTNEFINKAKLSGKNILIHCQLGISRSTTCLIAYMIKYLGYTTVTALQYIKTKRPHIMPNFGFLQQLKNYEQQIQFENNGINNRETNNNNINDNKFIKTELKFNEFLKKFPG